MVLTEADRERRREYSRQWRLRHPDYRRKWLEAHRAEENERKRRWRAANPDKVRQSRTYVPKAAEPPIPNPFVGHEVFEQARAICGERPYFDRFNRWEDTMSEVVLAIIEGRDPREARRKFLSNERHVEILHAPFFPNVDVREDGVIVFMSGQSPRNDSD